MEGVESILKDGNATTKINAKQINYGDLQEIQTDR